MNAKGKRSDASVAHHQRQYASSSNGHCFNRPVFNTSSPLIRLHSDGHPESVLSSMQTIMVVLLEESEEIQEDLLLVMLSILGRNKNDVTKAGRRLAMNVIEQCSGKLEPGIKQFLISSMSGDNRSLDCQFDYHEVMYDIYRCAPQVLSGVVPYLTGELLTDNIDIRLKAVRLVGDLFALPESTISETFLPIFSEFLKRLTDRVVEVRMSVLEYVKRCLLSNPSRAEAPQIISALFDRLLDYDENVRKQVVAVLCDVACCSLTSVPVETVKLVAERLRDKSLLVKMYTMERLAEIYNNYCLKCYDGSYTSGDDYDWIPGKILRCFYDKDFRSDAVEPILFNKEYVKEIFEEANMQKSTGSAESILSCMNILVIFACSIPSVLSGIEEDVVHLLEDENEVIKEGVLHVLSKAGGTIRDQLRISSRYKSNCCLMKLQCRCDG